MADDPGEEAPLLRSQSVPAAHDYQTRRPRRARFQDDSDLSESKELERSVEEEEDPAGEDELWRAYSMKRKRMASIVSIASRASETCSQQTTVLLDRSLYCMSCFVYGKGGGSEHSVDNLLFFKGTLTPKRRWRVRR